MTSRLPFLSTCRRRVLWSPPLSSCSLWKFQNVHGLSNAVTTATTIRKSAFSKGTNTAKTIKRPRVVKTSGGSVEGVWYTTAGSGSSLEMGRYGLKRLDYKTLKAPVWTVPPHPPTKNMKERILFPLTLVFTAGFGLWVYMNPEEEDMRDYWKRVETGQILVDDDDDDDDWDDDDEEED
mmetsp:Transcript_9958/g.17807  ORF Transcript_9958/g.17807 Transcript_9958/m.17807 type:complete len:179 (+) Transcript_9958:35-571(+)